MFCSQCGVEVTGPFCSKCGAKIAAFPETTANEPRAAQAVTDVRPTILLKAKNCREIIEEAEAKTLRGLRALDLWFTLPPLFGLLAPYIIAILNDKKLEYVDPLPWPLAVLFWGIIISGAILHVSLMRKSADIYGKYREYCSDETLIIDDIKIFGSTIRGDVKLPYDRIRSVDLEIYTDGTYLDKNLVPKEPFCDILTITDTANRQYFFYSFVNCREIKNIIEEQLAHRPASSENRTATPLSKGQPIHTARKGTSTSSWVCTCGKENPNYTTTCICGISKYDIPR